MSMLSEGKSVLTDAENRLRDLAAKAVSEGQYDAVVALADWAKSLRALVESATLPVTAIDTAVVLPRIKGSGGNGRGRPKVSRTKTARRGSAGKKEYPRFTREGDALVKVAWSKSTKAEYEHRAPHRVLSLVV